MDKNKSREPLILKRTEGGRCFQDPNLSPSGKKMESPSSGGAEMSLDGLPRRKEAKTPSGRGDQAAEYQLDRMGHNYPRLLCPEKYASPP